MNYQFMMKPLALMIAASFALVGCNSETASTENGAVDVAPAKSASINIGVKFPQPEVGAAWVGDASEVAVSFFRNDYVGSLDEAEDYVDAMNMCADQYYGGEKVMVGEAKLECWQLPENGMRDRFAKVAVLTPDAPTTSVELLPGKYRVEAEFVDASDKTRETSVSYVTIGEGKHHIALRGIAATWTAETPVSLQLLNKASDLDWDPNVEGKQTPAEAIGITGELLGMHLPSLWAYPDGLSEDWYKTSQVTEMFSHLVQTANRERGNASLYVPVLRIADGNGGEIDLHPERMHESEMIETDQGFSSSNYGKWTNLAALWQEYNAEDGSRSYPEFGSRGVYQSSYSSADGLDMFDNAYVLLGVSGGDEPEGDVDTERGLFNSSEYTYWDHEKQQTVNSGIEVADIYTDIVGNNWIELYLDVLKGRENSLVDGSTITGFLIEAMESYINGSEMAVPAALLDASLKEIAAQNGLSANAASSCNTIEDSSLHFSNQYMWDEANSQWVAGTINRLATYSGGDYGYRYRDEMSNLESELGWVNSYIAQEESWIQEHLDNGGREEDIQWRYDNITEYEGQLATITQNIETLEGINEQYLTIADLNKNGEVEIFEKGVFLENRWNTGCDLDVEWGDNYAKTYTFGCVDVDAKETVRAFEENRTIEMCIQPFTLKASELSISYSSDGDVIID